MRKIFPILLILILSFTVISFVQAQRASLYLTPSSGTYTVGNTFLVQVKVNTGGVAINAADGTLIFDPDKLEVRSISKEDSIFTLWVQEPIFSNSLGTINFAGGKPSPGFTGAAGTIINITFKARTSGTANVTFASGSVLADDGKGTNILASMGSGSYTLTTRVIAPPPTEEYLPPPPTVGVPAAPIVSSPPHPDENKWYSNNNPKFTWQLPTDVTQISYAIDKNPTTNPKFIAEKLLSEVSFPNLEDGTWYFHINFKNQYGWGKLTHRKVLIDTGPPLPFEIEVQREDPTDSQPVLLFETIDELSGIEYYEIKIGEGEPFPAEKIKTKSYKLPPQASGTHPVEVKAFDKAQNYTSATTEIEVLPIETPLITKFPKGIGEGQSLTLEGKSLPEATIRVFIQEKGKKPVMEEVKADEEGKWLFVSSALGKGDFEAWVEAVDKRGALSLPSSKISFWVGLPPFLKFGKIAVDYLSIMVTLIVLIIGALIIIFYSWYRISLWRKRVRAETKEVALAVLSAFKALREEVEEQIEYLDGKPGLNKDERQVRDKLKEALNISEEFIGKELKDIEKELE